MGRLAPRVQALQGEVLFPAIQWRVSADWLLWEARSILSPKSRGLARRGALHPGRGLVLQTRVKLKIVPGLAKPAI
jgi:hypothetical protein